MKDIRWKQRFENYEKSLKLLQRTVKAMSAEPANELYPIALIHAFEICFDLSWKCLKDYLEEQGHIIKTPRESIKQAFQNEIITKGHLWLEALINRNQTVHLYDETKVEEIADKILHQYLELLEELYNTLDAKR